MKFLHAFELPLSSKTQSRKSPKIAPPLIFFTTILIITINIPIYYPSIIYYQNKLFSSPFPNNSLDIRSTSVRADSVAEKEPYTNPNARENPSGNKSETLKLERISNYDRTPNVTQPSGHQVQATNSENQLKQEPARASFEKAGEERAKRLPGQGGDHNPRAGVVAESRGDERCDIFSGEWVPNPEGPYYTDATCWAIQEHQNCMKYGRPDTGFMKWRWKPDGCELPVFDPNRFLELVRGKSMAFVGDSIARNHMQSLICLLSRVAYPKDISNTEDENFKRWFYQGFDFNISIFWAPYLVNAERTDPNDVTRPFNLYLDEPDPNWIHAIERFDYVIISAGQWFFRPTMFHLDRRLVGCLYCSDSAATNITRHNTAAYGYRAAFRTAFKAINGLKSFGGVTFLRTFAPSHFENGEWNHGGDCVRHRPFARNETVLEGSNLEMYRIQKEELEIADREGGQKGLRFRLFDATRPMLLRPDGHPSRYGYWPVENVTYPNDCVHWCLPGPIDTWNDFLLELIKREAQ